jgi:hypothetical protein
VRKSNRLPFGGSSSRGGTITVIEARVHQSWARKAKLAFYITAIVVALLTMTIAADKFHPILAAFVGIAMGVTCGAVAWFIVRAWPVIRLLWWWTPEILLALAFVYGWTALARHTDLWLRLATVTALTGVPTLVRPIRRRIVVWAWCLIVRHRLRTCFAQFIIANQSGSLPFIFLARPTPVGERVLIYLRPGLSVNDLQERLDKMAVACHASQVTVTRSSTRTAGLVRIDTKRREVLTDTVDSPLVDMVTPTSPAPLRVVDSDPTALDLPDVTDPAARNGTRTPAQNTSNSTSRNGSRSAASARPVVAGVGGEDISDYID